MILSAKIGVLFTSATTPPTTWNTPCPAPPRAFAGTDVGAADGSNGSASGGTALAIARSTAGDGCFALGRAPGDVSVSGSGARAASYGTCPGWSTGEYGSVGSRPRPAGIIVCPSIG